MTHMATGQAPIFGPPSRFPPWIEQKFARLKAEWKATRGSHASADVLAMHPAYQKIIGMGPDVVPLLLRELDMAPDLWFWALRSITEVDPATEEMRGHVKRTTEAWLQWGRAQGYHW